MIKMKRVIVGITFLTIGIVYLTGCEESSTSGIEESLKTVPKVTAIEGAQNASIKVNKGTESSYFTIDFSNIEPNNYISNDILEGWCIAYNKPIDSEGAIQEGLKISLAEDDRWQPIRRLLGVKDKLLADNPEMTYREIQVAIWALRDFPKFELDKITVEDIPSRMVTNGNFNFNKDLVKKIIDLIKNWKDNFDNDKDDKELKEICVVETDSDTQTVIVPCEETFWAYGEVSFREGTSKGQWGWIYTTKLNEDNNYSSSTPLIAGAGQDDGTYTAEDLEDLWVGSLDASLNPDQGELLISYNATDGYQYGEAHLWVGCDHENLPRQGGQNNAAPGQFPFKYEPTDLFTEHTFHLEIGKENNFSENTIAACEDNEYHIAAHGVVGGKSIE